MGQSAECQLLDLRGSGLILDTCAASCIHGNENLLSFPYAIQVLEGTSFIESQKKFVTLRFRPFL